MTTTEGDTPVSDRGPLRPVMPPKDPRLADIPRSVRGVPTEADTIRVQLPDGVEHRWDADIATMQQHIRWRDDLPIDAVRAAVRAALRGLTEHLAATGRVVDAGEDLAPTVIVRLAVKTWPAVPGVTTPEQKP